MVEFGHDDLVMEKGKIGLCRGVPGVVHHGFYKQKSTKIAVKKYSLDLLSKTQDFDDEADRIRGEVIKMKQFRHENLLTCLSSFVSGCQIWLVTPLLSLGSVRDVIDSKWQEGIPEPVCAKVLRDVTTALEYLHSKAIVHRSVKCSHILLNDSGAKLSGLRYSCSMYDPPSQGLQNRYDYPLHVVTNNLNWLSPEMLQQNLLGYNEKSDIYSLGVAACEMANGLVPFSEMPSTLMFLEKLRGASPKLLDQMTFASGDEEALRTISPLRPTENELQPTSFSSNQPGDSGVGVSVDSSSNLLSQKQVGASTLIALKTKAAIYAGRSFSDSFHDFVEFCSILDPNERPSAKDFLISHSFLKPPKKSNGQPSLALSLTVSQEKSLSCRESQLSQPNNQLVQQMNSLPFEENLQWDF